MSTIVKNSEFDHFVDNYEDACHRGLALAGEDRDFFARERVAHTQRRYRADRPVRQVIDFGCGLGHTLPHLLEVFPFARALGVDPAVETIRSAQLRYGSDRASFTAEINDVPSGQSDLVYCNGVFHHIPPQERDRTVEEIVRWLRPGGVFALWENNPWNPGTRLVMHRIPFDRDAITLSYLESESMLRRAGLRNVATTFHFYFPSAARLLRPLESSLTRVPMGAQYCVFGRKPYSALAMTTDAAAGRRQPA